MKKQLLLLSAILLSGISYSQSNCSSPVKNGGATWYAGFPQDNGIDGHCSFKNSSVGVMYGAISTYSSAECGECLEVTGPGGTQIITIADECPPAQDGHCLANSNDIDLSPEAFDAIVADHNGPTGTGNISWFVVACPYANNPVTVSTRGCNQWYVKLVIGKHKNKINKVEILNGSNWVNLTRTVDNGWTGSANIPGNTQVRITDVFGEMITVNNVEIASGQDKDFTGTSNFKGCLTTNVPNYEQYRTVSYFPNPATDLVTFDDVVGVNKIEVYSILGELVYTQKYIGTASKIQLNTNSLAQGSYTFRLSTNSQVVFSNVLVKM